MLMFSGSIETPSSFTTGVSKSLVQGPRSVKFHLNVAELFEHKQTNLICWACMYCSVVLSNTVVSKLFVLLGLLLKINENEMLKLLKLHLVLLNSN